MATKKTYVVEWGGQRYEWERPKFVVLEGIVKAQMTIDALEKAKQYGKEYFDAIRAVFKLANVPDEIVAELYDDEAAEFYVALTQGLYPSAGGDEGNPEGGGSE